MAAAVMLQGTGSDVGKSLLVAGLARVFTRRGLSVAPFKPQNMSNNAAVTGDGGEIGRAQALQARAAGTGADVRMNPVLLKPIADTRSEVVVLGRPDPDASRRPWRRRKGLLWPVVTDALAGLRADFDLVVIEGAGSPAEINLRDGDLVNMAVAREAGAPVLLVADIDRGGAFAALYGTWALLPPRDRRHVRGFVLNRFRGDASLLEPGPALLEERTGIPVLGVVPRLRHRLPEEDAATLTVRRSPAEAAPSGAPERRGEPEPTRIAAVRLPHLSNFDDLDPLEAAPGVELDWVEEPERLGEPAAVVLPGTRNTAGDLRWLRAVGLAEAILDRARRGVAVVGLCGGFQMLGREVADPRAIEAGGSAEGLGLLPVRTSLETEKTTRRCRADVTGRSGPFAALRGRRLAGYEIHHGSTVVEACGSDGGTGVEGNAEVWLSEGGRPLGVVRDRIWGCYLHGIFADDALRAAWLEQLGAHGGTRPWEPRLESELNAVADAVEEALDVDELLAISKEAAT